MNTMRAGWITERRAGEGSVLAMHMTMTTVRVRRTLSALRKEPGMGLVQEMGQEKASDRQWRKGRGRGREIVMREVLLNKPKEEMISNVLWQCDS
jgi:hypothetical protein